MGVAPAYNLYGLNALSIPQKLLLPMPIDRETEKCLPLKEARSLFASQPHYKTLLAWADPEQGYQGIVLETFNEGRALITSHEAVARFIAAINGGS